jgi:hypothetical protein
VIAIAAALEDPPPMWIGLPAVPVAVATGVTVVPP